MRLIFFTLILLSIIISCKQSKQNTVSKNKELEVKNQKYIDVEIYCFCFLSDKPSKSKKGVNETTTKICTTPFRFTPGHLINPNYLLYKTNDRLVIDSITNIMFQDMKVSKNTTGIESRFVMLLKRNDLSADTLDCIDNRSVLHNGERMLEYPYSFLDSLKKIIKIEKIDCN
jgi:hypothetical protein